MATNANSISKLDPTPWDLLFLLLQPTQRGILFHKPESQELQKSLINRLKNSLSRTLDFFPPLAGRFSTVKNDDNTTSYFIDCNNAGVEFTHAVAGGVSISDILEPKYIPEIVSSLFPLNGFRNYEGVSKPLLGVQITELVDGLFIACTINHAVADGTSFWHFFDSWSEISRGLDKISKPPVFERWFPDNVPKDNPLIPLPPLELNLLLNLVPPPLLERVFHFTKESVAKLKAKANSEVGTTKISSFQAFSAHLWRSVTRCRYGKSTANLCGQVVHLVLLVGARARIPLANAYFGNAAYFDKIAATAEEIRQNGLGYCGLKINELVNQQTSEAAIKFVEDWVEDPIIWGTGGLSFIIASSPRHNVYGKPITVRSGKAQKFDGKMTVFPAAVEGGIDVEVCLAPEALQALEGDAEFMEAVTV
ncbi:Shikimate O-hydroxycinnamoyltransferase [Handroanthus impetiginosus]|uniref:Shikimate O-hydroxycinnamoyltransferase n=1 Tax=Handroanthus impetiginosus TaxID=429701 RepID=A0A2G9GJX3_9LAMI|nr:Shikimate O-hydroxycinnamoyltransferase [Handroanthus impetiginosus]